MPNIKILQIGKFYPPVKGGIEHHLYHLSNKLKNGFDVTVVVSNLSNKTIIENIEGIKVVRVASLGEIFSTSICPSMFYWLKKNKSDIVHIHLPNPFAHLSYLLSKPSGKLVIMWHSDIIRQNFFLKLYKPFLLKLLKKASKIIATSSIYLESSPFLNKFRDKCVVIPLGIDLSKFSSNEKVQQKVQKIKKRFNNNKIILFVGRLKYYKGLEYLIKAFKEIKANLIIIGKGPLEKKLKKLSNDLNLQNKIYFLGEVRHEEISLYFHLCDIFVLPSTERSEAFGIVQLEAMACAKPVISTNLKTGVPWVNQNEKTGIVVSPKDPEALAKAINTLLNDPKLMEEYGRNGKERVKREFTTEIVAERIMSLYHELLMEE